MIVDAKKIAFFVSQIFSNYEYKLHNTYIFDWESDFFAVSKSGYSVEVEIKISRSDFKRDFSHKCNKHEIFKNRNKESFIDRSRIYATRGERYSLPDGKIEFPKCTGLTWINPKEKLPNKFYYACPEGMIFKDEIPSYAGLIYIQTGDIMRPTYWIEKPAPFLHKNKACYDSRLLSKYYYRSQDVKQLLSSYLRHQNLTDDQYDALESIMNKLH